MHMTESCAFLSLEFASLSDDEIMKMYFNKKD